MLQNFYYLTLLIFLSACATQPDEKRAIALERWIGSPTSNLKEHRYFKNLPVKKNLHSNGNETWIFRDQSRYQSKAYCESLGGCIGLPFYNCDTAFNVRKGVILEVQQNGSCPPATTIDL